MIVVEGSLWPVVFLGPADDSALRERGVLVVNEELLEMSRALAIGVVVAGKGDQSVRAQQEVLGWLKRREDLLTSRALRLAWVIEDGRIRACTEAWLKCMGRKFLTVRSATFRTVHMALPWLLAAPWPLGPAIEGPGQMEMRASATLERRTAAAVSRRR